MPKKIVIPDADDLFDEETGTFISIKGQTLVIEHSLLSISKWEAKWKKPFLSAENKSIEEIIDYIKCMTINAVDPRIYDYLPQSVYEEINQYIEDPMTATTFSNYGKNLRNGKQEIVTSEVIYYDMISYGIPYEFEKWHINRLITLLHVFSVKNGGTKKMSRSESASMQRALNEQRLSKYGKKG